MDSINRVTLRGRLGEDPEIRQSKNGKPYMKLRLATDRNFMVNGEWKRKTAWHRAVYFGTDVDRYLDLSKGQWVTLEGSIEYSQSEGRDGTKRYWTDIIAHKLIAEGHQETDPDDTSDPDRMPF